MADDRVTGGFALHGVPTVGARGHAHPIRVMTRSPVDESLGRGRKTLDGSLGSGVSPDCPEVYNWKRRPLCQ